MGRSRECAEPLRSFRSKEVTVPFFVPLPVSFQELEVVSSSSHEVNQEAAFRFRYGSVPETFCLLQCLGHEWNEKTICSIHACNDSIVTFIQEVVFLYTAKLDYFV